MPGYILKAQEKLHEDDPIVSDDEDFDTDDDGDAEDSTDDYDDDDTEEDDPHERAIKERLANVQKKVVEIHAGMEIILDEIKKMRYDMEMCFYQILLLIKYYVTKNMGIKDLAQPTVDSVASQLDSASSSPALPPTMAANAAIRTSEYSQIVAADAPMPDAAA